MEERETVAAGFAVSHLKSQSVNRSGKTIAIERARGIFTTVASVGISSNGQTQALTWPTEAKVSALAGKQVYFM